MEHNALISLGSIFVFGAVAQWLAMRLKMPSILFLLIFGFIAGPILGIIHPDELFGDLLFPIISLSVAVILFEGGMDLNLKELKEIGQVVTNLMTIGVVVAWILISMAAYFILRWNASTSILIGAMLVVTGPTVVLPLLRHVRPTGRIANIAKWEGIMNDPIGVILAVLVFESILVGNMQDAGWLVVVGLIKANLISGGIGIISALILTFLLKRYWIPDTLHESVTLMLVFVTFILSNMVQVESGLLAVTLMGIVLANQKQVSIKHISAFKENLRVLMISGLFIILSARLELSVFEYLNFKVFLFLFALIFIIRPVSIFLATIGTELKWEEKLFLSWMAPRGIVAAAMASVFAFELTEINHPNGGDLIPVVFLVIIVTVALYGLTSSPLAHWLKLSVKNPQGILMVGAQSWARIMAKKLKELGFKVILIDTNKSNVRSARREGLLAFTTNILSDKIKDSISLDDIGRILCLTPNDEANSLAVLRFQETFGLANTFQLSPETIENEDVDDHTPIHLHGRYLFSDKINYIILNKIFLSGGTVEELDVDEGFDIVDWQNQFATEKILLFVVTETQGLIVCCADEEPDVSRAKKLIILNKNKV